jgi:class 3 adenylate cyclase/tetratricopeptide (TPR) repeat protein
MTCPHCHHVNPADARFCTGCGQSLALLCPACQTPNTLDSQFCKACGTFLVTSDALQPAQRSTPSQSYTPRHLADKILAMRSALEGERKQVTVLFADVVGFSTLAGPLDPEDVHTLMDGCFEILTQQVHRYEGTINQFTGDGIMALFGAPLTHEDHAMRALHAALGIQAALQDYHEEVQARWGVPVQMRLGVNTGLVVVGRIGDDLRMDYTAQGDTTNLAARLQQMAPAGAIWVGEATYRLAREAFEWQEVGAQAVKGKAEAVPVYALHGPRLGRSRFEVVAQRGLTRFVGRYPELQQLLAAWEQTEQGAGQVVSVVGEAGIGKSRLLYEFKQWLAQEDASYVEGSCFAYGDSISYLPFLEIVRGFCGLEGREAEADAKRQIAQRLMTLPLDPTTVTPYLHNLLAFPVDNAHFARLTPELIRQRTVEALTTLALAVARQQPLVVILEDVHWIDKASEEVLTAVVEAMVTVPVLLVLVYRPEYLHAWADRTYHAQIALTRLPGASSAAMVRAILTKPYAARVPLERLTPEQSQAMVQDLLGVATLPPELERLIVAKTDGNPLFVEELTISLLESGDLVQEPAGYRLTRPLAALDIPATVQGVLLARIDRLREDLKSVLQVASVIGRVFSHPLLAYVLQQGPELEQILLQLQDLEFLYPTTLAPQREYSFKHVLTQETVYQTLLRPKREEYHERSGKAIEALYAERLEEYYEVLAYHYGRSGNKDKAVEYLDLANQKAAKANAMEEAKRYFDEAMTLLDTLPETEGNRHRRIVLLLNQGAVMVLLEKLPEYYDLLTRYEAMAIRIGEPGLLGAFYAGLGWGEYGFGHFDQAIRTLTKAADLCEAAGNVEAAGLAYLLWEWSYMWKGDYYQALTLQEDALRMMEQRVNCRWYMWAATGASLAYTWLGRWEQAVAEGLKGVRVSEEFADNSVLSFAANVLSIVYTLQGDLGRALEYGELAVQKAATPADEAWAQAALAWIWCRAGEPHRGVEVLAQVVPRQRATGQVYGEIFALFLGEGYWLTGEYDKAQQALTEHLHIAERNGMQLHIGAAHRLLGEIALTTNPAQVDAPLAAPHFEQSISILQQIHAENELALAYAGYGRLLQQQGNLSQARDYLTRAQAIFERLTLGEPDKVKQALAALLRE